MLHRTRQRYCALVEMFYGAFAFILFLLNALRRAEGVPVTRVKGLTKHDRSADLRSNSMNAVDTLVVYVHADTGKLIHGPSDSYDVTS